jgi:hypothetical protein
VLQLLFQLILLFNPTDIIFFFSALSTVIFIPAFSGCLATNSDVKRSVEQLKLRSFVYVIGLRSSAVPLWLGLRESDRKRHGRD